MKFRIDVHKLKCTTCDLIFLVERNKNGHDCYVCPACDCSGDNTEHMGDITIVQEDN